MTWLFLSYYGLEGLIAHTDKDTLLLERSAVQALLTSFTCEIYLKLGKKNREIHLIKPFLSSILNLIKWLLGLRCLIIFIFFMLLDFLLELLTF